MLDILLLNCFHGPTVFPLNTAEEYDFKKLQIGSNLKLQFYLQLFQLMILVFWQYYF